MTSEYLGVDVIKNVEITSDIISLLDHNDVMVYLNCVSYPYLGIIMANPAIETSTSGGSW